MAASAVSTVTEMQAPSGDAGAALSGAQNASATPSTMRMAKNQAPSPSCDCQSYFTSLSSGE
jgi:hypothetical protein